MTPRRFVFNPPAATLFTDGPTTRYLVSNEPSIILEELPISEQLHGRHGAQRTAMAGLALPDDPSARSALFEDDPSIAFRAYRVRRLWVDTAYEREDPEQKETPPLGNAPPRALAASTLASARLEALLEQQGTADTSDEVLYLFSPIVALEWLPTPTRLRRLQWAFRRASDYLYDVTNGTMAFGQVIFGDATWMQCADIQILASNRYLPRSWVGGLYESHKYTPIRLGRGLWVRERRVVVDWDEPEGYRAIVHEWAHYALGLKDEYLRGRVVYDEGAGRLGEQATSGDAYRVVLPDRRVKSESVMASPQGNSELGNPLPIASDNMRQVITQRYPALEKRLKVAWSGPGQLPLPLPTFRLAGALAAKGYRHNERPCAIPFTLQGLTGDAGREPAPAVTLDNDTIPTGRREVFVLSHDDEGALRRVSAQGELDARAPEQGFTLLGARPGNHVVILDSVGPHFQVWRRVLGEEGDKGLIANQWERIEEQAAAPAEGRSLSPATLSATDTLIAATRWQRESLPATPADQTLAVIPLARENGLKNSALVHLEPVSAEVAVFAVDGQERSPDSGNAATFDLPSLDGYVVARTSGNQTQNATTALAFYDFSQGGPPASAPSLVSDPIAAGAASGEALILCDVTDKSINTAGYRVITTTSRGLTLPAGLEALSPVYTIASNLLLRESFTPTLLIVNVQGSPADAARTRVCLLNDDGTYTALPTYVAPNAAYGAAPLTATSVPTLISDATEPDPGPEGAFIGRFVLARVPGPAMGA